VLRDGGVLFKRLRRHLISLKSLEFNDYLLFILSAAISFVA
jgi:hypothetical protein